MFYFFLFTFSVPFRGVGVIIIIIIVCTDYNVFNVSAAATVDKSVEYALRTHDGTDRSIPSESTKRDFRRSDIGCPKTGRVTVRV